MNTKSNEWHEKPGDWFQLDELDATKANYRVAMSQRGPGKTYAFKKRWVDVAFDSGFEKQGAYIRRTAEESKPSLMGTLFDDMMDYILYKLRISRPEVDGCYITCRQDKFTLYSTTLTDSGDIIKEEVGVLGYYFCLARSQYYKSGSYPKVKLICFDEAIPEAGKYCLPHEFETFLNLISTIKRQRDDVIIYIFGNTVNLQAQIFDDMGVNVRNLTKGAVKLFEYENAEGVKNSVAVQWSRKHVQSDTSTAYFVFNNAVERAILDGDFQTDDVPTEQFADPDSFRHRAFVVRKENIKLFIYQYKDSNKWYATSTRLGATKHKFKYYSVDCSEAYITTNLQRRMIGGSSEAGQRVLQALRKYHEYGLFVYDNDITGDDTSFILGSHNGR